MPNYWWAYLDKLFIEQHPGWIWNIGERKPKYFGSLVVGDYFVLAANRGYDGEPLGTPSVYGIYEVKKECPEEKTNVPMVFRGTNRIVYRKAWVVEGTPDKKTGQRWITLPPLSALGIRFEVPNQTINPMKSKDFRIVKQWLTNPKANVVLGILEREPQYEQEVIALFISNMERWGYKKVLSLQPSFPDGRFLKSNGSEEEIEFEYLASGLKIHEEQEPRRWKNVTYVCWENDLTKNSKYRNVRIISLREKLTQLTRKRGV